MDHKQRMARILARHHAGRQALPGDEAYMRQALAAGYARLWAIAPERYRELVADGRAPWPPPPLPPGERVLSAT